MRGIVILRWMGGFLLRGGIVLLFGCDLRCRGLGAEG